MSKHITRNTDTQYEIDYMKDIAEFRHKVRALREAQNISLDELADRIICDKSALSRIENGDRVPRLDRVLQIADALHTAPAKLLPNRFLDVESADLLF